MARLLAPLLLLATGACTAQSSPPRRPDPVVVQPAWQRDDVVPVSRPELVGGAVVLYEAKDGVLRLSGFDPATGRTRWSVPASDGAGATGVDLRVENAGDTLVHLRPGARPGQAAVTATDARTGRRLWSDPAVRSYSGLPEVCEGDAAQACVTAEDGDAFRDLRFRLADGRVQVARGAQEATGRELGPGLRDTGERDPDVLAGVDDDGRVLWRRPAPQLFGRPVSSDVAWYVGDHDGVLVGHLGRSELLDGGDPDVARLLDFSSVVVTAGFERATGEPLWQDPGTIYRCFGGLDAVLTGGGDLPFRCRSTGKVVYPLRDDVVTTARPVALDDGLQSVVEGFEPRTGRTTWKADVGTLPVLGLRLRDDLPVLGLGGHRVVLSGLDGGHTELDLDDGTTRQVGDDVVGWCVQPPEPVALVEDADGDGPGYRSVPDLVAPCRADGLPVQGPARLDDGFGLRSGDLLVWAVPTGLRAARQVSGPLPSATASATPAPSRAAAG